MMIPGIAAYCISPYRFVSFGWGLIVQLCVAGFLYWTTVPDLKNLKDIYKKLNENPKDNILVFIITLVGYLVFGVIIAVGVKSGFLRFVFYVIMWIGALVSSTVINEIIFIKLNRENLLIEKEKEEAAIALKNKQQAEMIKEKARKDEEARKAEKERIEKREAEQRRIAEEKLSTANSEALQELSAKRQPRIQATASPMIYSALISGQAMGWDYALSGLRAALSDPTPEALAALEKVIAEYAGKEDITFYKLGGMRVFTGDSVESVRDQILGLALTNHLLIDPAYTQSLIAGLGGNTRVSNDIMAQLAFNPKILFEYQMLGVHMQLSQLLKPGSTTLQEDQSPRDEKTEAVQDENKKTTEEKQQAVEVEDSGVVDDLQASNIQNNADPKIDTENIKLLITQLSDDADFAVRWKAGEQLKEIGAPAISSLVEALQDNKLRVGAADALRGIGEPSVEPLINALSDPEWRVRFVVANTLGQLNAKKAVPSLIELLNDPQPEVRRYSAEALGSIGDPQALQPLKDRLTREDSMMAISGIEEGLRRLQKNN